MKAGFLTASGYHSGSSLGRIRALRLVAMVPVLIAAVITTGQAYLQAIGAHGGAPLSAWRDRLAHWLFIDSLPLAAWNVLVAGLVHVLPVFLFALLAAGLCERLFAEYRNRPFDTGFIYSALVFTMLVPPGAGIFHVVFGMFFATLLVQGIFGGEGRGFLNPALVGVAIVQISFPAALADHPLWSGINGYAGSRELALYHQQQLDGLLPAAADWWRAFVGVGQGPMGTTSVLAAGLGAVILLYTRIVCWRILAAQLLGVILLASLFNISGGGIASLPWYGHWLLGSYAFTAIFVATDPSASAQTRPGRWIQGLLLGALLVLVRNLHDSHPDSVIPVVLLVSMAAPLIDHVVAWFNIRRRRARHG